MKYELDIFSWGEFKTFTQEDKEKVFNEILEFLNSNELKAGYAGGLSKRKRKKALYKYNKYQILTMKDKREGYFQYGMNVFLHCDELVKIFLDKWESLRNAGGNND